MHFSKDGKHNTAEAALVVVAVGWAADTAGLNLAAAGVDLNQRRFVKVDEYLRTSAPHIFAAGDVTGRLMLAERFDKVGNLTDETTRDFIRKLLTNLVAWTRRLQQTQ